MKRQLLRAGGILTVLLIPAVIGYCTPDIDNQESLCPFMRLFHIPCPGCGFTKSMIHLYRGEPVISIHYHWWGIPFVLFSIYLLGASVYDIKKGSNIVDRLLDNALLWQIIAVAISVTYIVRLAAGTCFSD